ncbi:hypothetical protein BESB_003560 [Besnoitia besnoiti]|uniref:Uncharacterized protein n=1 Tax=Besnoitia besnoiti TaxID=94643 RepID=A0A2A9MJ67_BESBE|nr:hypothetical protein BESB_003560 [Besnoitia besnoiti]PFH38015.1 hypothetical protein BESB_003560 [Besnoitia besnoiti]
MAALACAVPRAARPRLSQSGWFGATWFSSVASFPSVALQQRRKRPTETLQSPRVPRLSAAGVSSICPASGGASPQLSLPASFPLSSCSPPPSCLSRSSATSCSLSFFSSASRSSASGSQAPAACAADWRLRHGRLRPAPRTDDGRSAGVGDSAPSRNLAPSSLGVAAPSFWSLFSQTRAFSAHPYKPKSREVFHPHVPAPEHLPPPGYTRAVLNPMQQFIPKDFFRDMVVDSLRDGVSLGSDFPWNVTHKYRFWRRRKYNIQMDDCFIRLSPITGVDYYPRLNVFAVQWREDGQHRIRWFRAAYGLKRAMRAAENFRRTLEATGRVDNWRTARHLRQQMLERRQQLKLRKKRFAKISSGQF